MSEQFKVIDIRGKSPEQLEEELNKIKGYKRISQSNLEWYQGLGESGVIVFEREEVEHG